MKARTCLKLNNLRDNQLLPMASEADCCLAIIDLKLEDHEFLVIEQTIESEIVEFGHTLNMFKEKKKAKKKPDVEAEGKAPPIEVIGEVIG